MDFEDRNTLSLFFDDNARLNTEHPEKNAIAPFDLRNGKTITPLEAIKAGNLFPVDTLEALNDPEYFVKLLDIALDETSRSQIDGGMHRNLSCCLRRAR